MEGNETTKYEKEKMEKRLGESRMIKGHEEEKTKMEMEQNEDQKLGE